MKVSVPLCIQCIFHPPSLFMTSRPTLMSVTPTVCLAFRVTSTWGQRFHFLERFVVFGAPQLHPELNWGNRTLNDLVYSLLSQHWTQFASLLTFCRKKKPQKSFTWLTLADVFFFVCVEMCTHCYLHCNCPFLVKSATLYLKGQQTANANVIIISSNNCCLFSGILLFCFWWSR